MYVDILFPLIKLFQLSLKLLPQITKLYEHGKAIMQRVTTTSTCYYTRYHTRFRSFLFILT